MTDTGPDGWLTKDGAEDVRNSYFIIKISLQL
jgi:hypothetical protein